MLSIVQAAAEDAALLLQIKIRAFRDEVALYGFGPPGYDSPGNQIRAIRENLYFKILDDECTIGGICVRPQREGRYWIGALFVDLPYLIRTAGSAPLLCGFWKKSCRMRFNGLWTRLI